MTATLFDPAILERQKPCPACAGLGELEATDIFCGAGGSSLGLEHVRCLRCGRPLIRVTQALNHWDLAVEAHNANFPGADHDVHDIEVIPARRFRRTPLLWASPECTHHAYCRGPRAYDPSAQRSRATFGDIVRFTEYHRYDAIIVENVIEARLWCEAGDRKHGWDPRRREYRCSCGVDFDEWFAAMLALGYEGRIVYFNSQFALPTPQSRDRMYVVFWRNGLPAPNLDFSPAAWCERCEHVVQGQQTWKKASRGSVRDQQGMFEWGRYGSQYVYTCPTCQGPVAPAVTGARTIIDWALPAQRIGDRDAPLAPKTRERIKAGLERLQTLDPVVVHVGGHLYERRPGVRIWSVDDPMRTVITALERAVVVPNAALVRYGGQAASPRDVSEPMQTITAHDREVGVVVPNREHATGATLDEPARSVTTAPAQHMLVQVNRKSKKAVDRNAGTLGEPTRTIAGHGELAVVSFRNNGDAQPADVPAQTVSAGGYHHGLLVYNGVPGFVQPVAMPSGVVKGRDSQSLLVPYYRTGVARTLGEPAGTVTSRDREALVITEDDIDACLFRMLQWPELLRAQAPFDHIDGRPYLLTARRRGANGKVRELSNELRVKMIGNMVSSQVATMLGYAIVGILR